MVNRLTPLAFLLRLLDISYTEISCVIGIDRSVINKWALGTRPFHARSKHYSRVAEYILQKNEQAHARQLENFFCTIYSDATETLPELRRYVDRFLSCSSVSLESMTVAGETAKKSMQRYIIPTTTSTSGRFAMLMQLFDEAAELNHPADIVLFDNEQFEWIVENPQLFLDFKEHILKVLDEGHHVSLISNVLFLEKYGKFAKLIPFLYPYKNFTEYHYTAKGDLPFQMSYYAIKGRRLIYSKKTASGSFYTVAQEDLPSLQSFEILLANHQSKCVPHLVAATWQQRITLFLSINQSMQCPGAVYLCSPMLTFVTMSRQLLLDIMEQNQIDLQKRRQILFFYSAQRNNMTNMDPQVESRQICHYQHIQQMFRNENSLSNGLSLFFGKEIILSRELLKRHIADTAQLLDQNINYHLGLIRYPQSKQETEFNMLCKENQFYLTSNQVFKCIKEPQIINRTIFSLHDTWNSIPADYKDNAAVASKLRSIIE